MRSTPAYAAPSAGAPLVPFTLHRRAPRPHDVVIAISHCGVCHSDVHQARDEWGGATFPMVPGHEIVGRVVEVGEAVKGFAVGDGAGVGCMVDACRVCPSCADGHEQFCAQGCAWTYNGTEMDRVTPTHGGYSALVVVDERFVLRVPDALDPARAAPLLCAGVTTWSPLRQWGCAPGMRVGVVGLGGLGHMAVKLAAAMGAEVTVFSTSDKKRDDAIAFGAKGFCATQEPGALAAHARTLDLVIDTVSAPHDLAAHMATLRPFGTLVLVGVPPEALSLGAFALISGNRRLAGSLIGGIAETQAMLDFCAAHGVAAEVEVIRAAEINAAYDRMMRGDVRYRFVIDAASLTA